MTSTRPIPSHDDIRRLLGVSRNSLDPRSSAAITLILAHGFNENEIDHIRWSNVDLRRGSLVRTSRKRQAVEPLTELTVRQLLALKPYSASGRIFRPTKTHPTSLRNLLASVMQAAGLAHLATHDLVEWSRLQSQSVRLAIATPA